MALKHYLEQHETYRQRPEKSTASIGGSSVDLEDSQTLQQVEDSILGANVHGVHRGKEAYQARKLGETWAMEIIKNAINDQLSGADLGRETPEDIDPSPAATSLWELLRDVLDGPHLQKDSWNDLVSAVVSDMADIGNGYLEPIGSADGSIPVAALKPVDALTIRHNVTATGEFDETPFYQAPFRTHAGSIVSGVGDSELTPLDHDDLVVMRYPGSKRSNRIYPRAPGMQVQAALEHLTHSTIHAQRFYNDNELPSGFVQMINAGEQDFTEIEETIKNAAGDPRKVGVIGGDGPANWIEMGGTALNLDIIGEQQWFLQLCLAAFGLTKGEIAMTEDVNYNTADAELSIVHKRVTQGFLETLEDAITTQVFRQFESYQELPDEQRFSLKLTHSDPRQERAREEHLRERYEAGTLPLNAYLQKLGEETGDTTVEIAGVEIDYGEHPKYIIEQLIRDARGSASDDSSEDGGDGDDGVDPIQ
ncbi:hypothetical protein C482_15311 [Natrialba chahannaoensis JCM 10990]|uniref:Portal protein n=1 Tax=Natrialba chahannaoensis JCM 10990 TaxID=1227492 RepID=M0ADB9_9EURY|nr:phage portal protein [Natrialba chahannaoensis]ELY96755.1 hypothetical protein C482_15311 [Natrialba chahannaoensis JCM 10990]